MTGRPTSFTPELGDLICSLLAEGQSLRKVCKLDDMPHLSTVMDWLAKGTRGDERYRAFADQYAQAREMQAELYADEIVDIADDGSNDDLFTDEGKRVPNSEWITRSRLRVDSRKWVAAKLLPKKYGDRIQQDIGGQPDNPVRVDATVALTPADAYRKMLEGE